MSLYGYLNGSLRSQLVSILIYLKHIILSTQRCRNRIAEVCISINFYFLCLGLGKIIVQVIFKEKEKKMSLLTLFSFVASFTYPVFQYPECAVGKLLMFFMIRFKIH